MGRVLEKVNDAKLFILRRQPSKFWDGFSEIGRDAFAYQDSLYKIKIPKSITKIGNNAFNFCINLNKVTIEEGVEQIGWGAFSACRSLKEIVIPGSVKVIEPSAFSECTNLKKIHLDYGVKEILGEAFVGCVSLKEIIIPESAEVINAGAFKKCLNLEKAVLPTRIHRLAPELFAYCENLKEVELPESIDDICKNMFYECRSLEHIELPENIKRIDDFAFLGCESLKHIDMPTQVHTIGTYAFSECESLEEITLPSDLLDIKEGAFRYCENLKKVRFSNKIENFGEDIFDYDILQYLIVEEDGTVILSNTNEGHEDNCCYIKDLFEVIPNLNLGIVIENYSKINSLNKKVKKLKEQEIEIPNVFVSSYRNLTSMLSKDYKIMKNILKFSCNRSDIDLVDLYNLAFSLGVFENSKISVKGKEVLVKNIAYTILQKAINEGYLKLEELHSHFQSMAFASYSEQFLMFFMDKTNFYELLNEEMINNGFIVRVYEWFKERENLNIDSEINFGGGLPSTESNRYKLRTYETSRNGVDRIRWKKPTVSLLKKEFIDRKFSGIVDDRSREIAEYLDGFHLYSQKHYDKAIEIDTERKEKGVSDHLTQTIVKEDVIESLEDYKKRTAQQMQQMIEELGVVNCQQIDTASKIFTYEMMAKSDKANFAMGILTNCCATLYGAGAGAQRAMILHPDMQPLVIRDISGAIAAFGIIYVNREEGYAVINDFEVNSKYRGKQEEKEEIYIKALQGVEAFVKQYNSENSSKIKIVTCGISPNWSAINDYIRKNPKSEILKAPDFDDFKYAGSGSWSGDWHKEQYIIWQESKEKTEIRSK